MADHPKQKTFYRYTSRHSKHLPLDYSIKEFSEFLGINQHTVHSYTWGSPWFHSFFSSIQKRPLQSEKEEKRGVSPIPIEVAPYFYRFISMP